MCFIPFFFSLKKSYAPRSFQVIHESVLCVRFASNNSNKSNLSCYKHTQKCSLMSKCLRWWWTHTVGKWTSKWHTTHTFVLEFECNGNSAIELDARTRTRSYYTPFSLFNRPFLSYTFVAAKLNVSPYYFVVPLELYCWQSVALLYATPHRVSLALSIVLCVSLCVFFFLFVQSVYFVLVVCWVWRSPEKPIHHSVCFQWYARYDSFRAYICHNHLFALFAQWILWCEN